MAVVVLGTLLGQELPAAQLILPVTTVAEEHGAFVNRDLRVQRYQQARTAPGMARPAWWIASEAGRLEPSTAAEAFALVANLSPALAGLTYGDLGMTGRVVQAGVPAPQGA
jgi:predicted molibdopterin-dependent oxidoreductase YjgC